MCSENHACRDGSTEWAELGWETAGGRAESAFNSNLLGSSVQLSAPLGAPATSSVKSGHGPKVEVLNVNTWLGKKLAFSPIVNIGSSL